MLVLRPGALGDTLLTVPALRALRRTFGRVTLGAHAATARLLQELGEIERGLAFDDPSLAWVFSEHAPNETVVAWMSATQALRRAAVVAPSRPADEQHCAHYLLSTLSPLGIDLTFDDHPLGVSPILTDDILVHPGSGSPRKNWPPRQFAAVIRRLDRTTLVVGEADHAAARAVEESLGRQLPRLECATLEELAARLAGCRAYLGNDSGVSHLAGLCGARTVVMFGPSDARVWRPVGPRVQVVGFEAPPDDVVDALSA